MNMESQGNKAAYKVVVYSGWVWIVKALASLVLFIGVYLIGVFTGTNGGFSSSIGYIETNFPSTQIWTGYVKRFDANHDVNSAFSPAVSVENQVVLIKLLGEMNTSWSWIEDSTASCEYVAKSLTKIIDGTE